MGVRLDGAGERNLGGGRYSDFSEAIKFMGVNWTTDTFLAQVRAVKDTEGPPVFQMTISGPTLVDDGANTQIILSVPKSSMEDAPTGATIGENTVLFWDLVRVSGSSRSVVLYGTFTVIAGVTQ